MTTLVSISQAARALGVSHAALLAILGEAPDGVVTFAGAWTRIDLGALQAWFRTFGTRTTHPSDEGPHPTTGGA